MLTSNGNNKKRTPNECIESLETLFKSYSEDSEFGYQLHVSNSPFNTLRDYIRILNIIKYRKVNIEYLIMIIKESKNSIYGPLYNYNAEFDEGDYRRLTGEEFELIKEWLENNEIH